MTIAIIDSGRVAAKLTRARGRRKREAKGQEGSFLSAASIIKVV